MTFQAVNNDLPIEYQLALEGLYKSAEQQKASKETLLIHDTRKRVGFLRELWPAARISSSLVEKLNEKATRFQIVTAPALIPNSGEPTTTLTHIAPSESTMLHDGSYNDFVRKITRWVWKRIQTHRVKWIHSTEDGQALEEATQKLKHTLDRAYAKFDQTRDQRIYPQGELHGLFGIHYRGRWTDDLRNEICVHARMFSFGDFKLTLRPNQRLNTENSLGETIQSCKALTSLLTRANEELSASMAHWEKHHEGKRIPSNEEEDWDAAEEPYSSYDIPALKGKYAGKVFTRWG
jgi:hypothetical protein